MRISSSAFALLLLAAPSALAASAATSATGLPNLSTVTDKTTAAASSASSAAKSSSGSLESFSVTSAPPASSVSSSASSASTTGSGSPTTESVFQLTGLPTIQGVGVPSVGVPDTAAAPYMQKSNLPDGTVFICVGAALGFFGAAVLAWRGLVAWSLHRSVKRAATAQNLSDLKATMSTNPGARKKGMYNVVGGNSNLSLDRLSAAPMSTSKPPKPFASTNASTPPKQSASSLFYSPTAGATHRDSINRSSNYLPAGYYAAGNSQTAQGSPVTHVGGHGPHTSPHSLGTPGNRFSTRSGVSPPGSPSLPPSSRGYDSRPPPSRDGVSIYNRNSVATLGTPSGGIYGHGHGNPSQLSLNVPGGTSVAGGRAPSAYLEDLFENHGNGPRERF